MEHLFKLKKDGKTVGYLQLKSDVPSPKTAAENPLTATQGLIWYNAEKTIMALKDIEIQWDTAHLFVTQDKHGKDVFAGDKVIYRPPDIDVLCEDEEEELEASITGGFLIFDFEETDFVETSKFGDIELIEDKKNA